MISYRQQERDWLAINPLRQWRTDRNYFLKDVGAAIGVGYHSIFRWENGMSMPNDKQMIKLETVTKIKNLREQLEKWQIKRPKLI